MLPLRLMRGHTSPRVHAEPRTGWRDAGTFARRSLRRGRLLLEAATTVVALTFALALTLATTTVAATTVGVGRGGATGRG